MNNFIKIISFGRLAVICSVSIELGSYFIKFKSTDLRNSQNLSSLEAALPNYDHFLDPRW